MAVTVKQIMELEVLKNAKVSAGIDGLDNVISRVSFIDSPISPEVLEEKGIMIPGDFYISSLFIVKDNPEQMLEIMRILLTSKASGLCIISKLFIQLPAAVVNFSDEHAFPIIFNNKYAPYGDMIRDIFDLILHDKEDTLIDLKLNNIIEPNQTDENVKKTLLSVNSHFSKYILVIFIQCPECTNSKFILVKNIVEEVKEWRCLKFRNNILVLLSFDDSDIENLSLKTRYVTSQIKLVYHNFIAGVSDLHPIEHANKGITEALISSENKPSHEQEIIYYKDLGLYKFLLPLRDTPELKKFHNEIISPILAYDEQYKQNLLKTAICFIDNECDFSRTARKMHLHENSVRYRINKIMELVNMKHKNMLFYEQLSVAIKLHKIQNRVGNGH